MITDLLKQLKDLSLVSQGVGSAVKISERRESAIQEAQEAAKTAGRTAKKGSRRRDRRGIQAQDSGAFRRRVESESATSLPAPVPKAWINDSQEGLLGRRWPRFGSSKC